MTTTVTPAEFRANFIEFANDLRYPNAPVKFWLDIAAGFINSSRWGRNAALGIQLYAAHNLVLERQAVDAAERNGVPGQNTGPVNNKSVDKVSVGFDSGSASVEGAANWNLTIYGTRYIQLARMHGAGGLQVGLPQAGVRAGNRAELSSQNAWVGPWQPNFPNMNG